MNVAYCEHPVSREDKLKLRKSGFKVIDIKFAPEKLSKGDKLVKKPKPKVEKKETESE